MSLIKSIIHGKEHRKMYKGAKSYCYACCNHKSCTYCKRNRLYNYLLEYSFKFKACNNIEYNNIIYILKQKLFYLM